MKTEQQEIFFNLKHGALWLAVRGLTTQRKYAKLYTKVEAEAVKKHYLKNKFLVEIHEAAE